MEIAKSYGLTTLAFIPITIPVGIMGTVAVRVLTGSNLKAIAAGFAGSVGFNTYLFTAVRIEEGHSVWLKKNATRFSYLTGGLAAGVMGGMSQASPFIWIPVAAINWYILQKHLFSSYVKALEA